VSRKEIKTVGVSMIMFAIIFIIVSIHTIDIYANYDKYNATVSDVSSTYRVDTGNLSDKQYKGKVTYTYESDNKKSYQTYFKTQSSAVPSVGSEATLYVSEDKIYTGSQVLEMTFASVLMLLVCVFWVLFLLSERKSLLYEKDIKIVPNSIITK
jgi:hypothetical protein